MMSSSGHHQAEEGSSSSKEMDMQQHDATHKIKEEKRTTIAIVKKLLAVLALAAVLSLPLFFASSAFAVESGGRIGGSYGRSEPSVSSSTPAPTMNGYSRGFGQGFGAGYLTPRPFWGDSFGFGLGPFYRPFGGFWGGGGWGMPYFGGGVTVYSPLSGFFAFSTVSVILLVFFSALFSGSGSSSYRSVQWTNGTNVRNEGVTFCKCSVAMNVPSRDDPNSILTVLKQASKTARTDSRAGMQYLVNQVALEILRRRRTIIAANTKRSYYKRLSPAESEFNTQVIRERSKFEKELISKYGGVDFVRDTSRSFDADQERKSNYYPSRATIAVVTIMVLLEGDTKLPAIKSMNDVEEALSRIAADVKEGERLLSAEVLWTPVDCGESLSEKEVFSDYPALTTV
eukprot:CAMPEP_0116015230 /NCGR_PEP_ID=MMETSP0321-20121206/6720_1 /TAXON_ID=163516 /ORGANISM="Leptocylindrus danicus var. danicus, Strain B650" /LENGTH=398 /DNA_ID=CAMNT_0003484975 /DNA_START=538 /DNA_END=1734 /DNA_ORIENTATION=+